MPEHFEAGAVALLDRLRLTAEDVRTHVIRPPHLVGAETRIDLHEAGDVSDPEAPAPPSGVLYWLDTTGLADDLHRLLSRCVAGYSMQLRRFGQVVFSRNFGKARVPVAGDAARQADVPWQSDVQMHVASVSKLITAMAMTRLLHSRGVSVDASIAPWLPAHWTRGPGIGGVTFRQLLTHTSGLVALDEPGRADYAYMKEQVAVGVTGVVGYRNINYALCRVLIATMDAPYLFDLVAAGASDAYWDRTTTRYFQQYVQTHVFDPVGVVSDFLAGPRRALAYGVPVAGIAPGPGEESPDLSTMSGAVGWHLSVDELLAVMAAFRRRHVIVEGWRAQQMLDRGFGLDAQRDTPLGRIYVKGGFWSFRSGSLAQQANVCFLPKGMELAVLCNSPLCKANGNMQTELLDAIERHIRLRFLTIAAAAAATVAVVGSLGRAEIARRRGFGRT